MKNLDKDIASVCFSEEDIRKRVQELGAQITADYQGKDLVLISILRGSFVFCSDLMRAIDLPCELMVMQLSSYGNNTDSSGAVKVVYDLDSDIAGRDVLVVEDILDTGTTLCYLRDHVLQGRHPASFAVCAMFDKKERRTHPIEADYCGFDTPNEFVVGYGLDYAQKYRNLPYLGLLKPSVYEQNKED